MGKISERCREAERTVLRLLHNQSTRSQLAPIHGYSIRRGIHRSNQILAHFVSICGSLGKMSYAHRIFSQTQNPNILLFNSMIKGYSLCGPHERSLDLFYDMKGHGIWPDEYTYTPMLKCCSNLGDVRTGEGVHAEVIRGGFDFFNAVQIGVIEFYVACGRMGSAQKVFDEMPNRGVIVWNLMVRGFCRAGKVDVGFELFRQMIERNVVSWNTMISCLGQSGRDGEALGLFREMMEEGFEPDEATVVTLLPICARSGAAGVGLQILLLAESSGLLNNHVSVGNSIIDFHCKCGDLETAMKKFEEMPRKNVVTWNTMITGAAFNGKSEVGIDLYKHMMMEKGNITTPNHATFVAVLTCCSHSGLVDMARELFTSMAVEPKIKHYGCMVDLLSRSGHVEEAYGLIKNMAAVKPNAALWSSLLSGCRIHGELEIAELALKELIEIEPSNSGNYVLLSNLFADTGRWEEVEKIRGLMKENVVDKVLGNSAIGLN